LPSSTVENYLKAIFALHPRQAEQLVQMGDLASEVGVTPGTATAMIKTLAGSGLVDYEPRGGVRLTEEGRILALHVLRRHRLIELFLVEILGLDWSHVHAEAEELEHAISDKVLDRIDTILGRPNFDPHGDPIPTAGGTITTLELQQLANCHAGESVRIRRVSDQNPEFLQFAYRCGLTPGSDLAVVEADASAETMTVRSSGGHEVTIGMGAAGKVLVEELKTASSPPRG